ncbi:uncharacterized protein LOC129571962 [Sitodiplosis mosellana]|uniref:uncharacterized protein LOC129571962 n=1 Tax=Sitodiplosis mosellana TaxID=263140 RepID=UPI002444E486|nr:uncharacterized protein LOC129571962 [Sitodiplosis mosellana]
MNKSAKQLCCVCSGSGEHDAFGRIPVNVHANPNEFRFWRETIAEYIADISGIYLTKDEKNYPQKICTICITYLKHAVTFRKQVINNDRCIRQQTFYPGNEPFNIKALMQNDYNGGGGGGDTVWNDMNLAPESITFDSLKMEIEEAFGGECDDSDDEEADDAATSTTMFNYKEKSFTEDDITDFVHKSVVITIPDEMRERKCDACKQRFMLKESFDQHLKECIELKLNKFITEGYQLLSMRKSRALSANEFNRRMIFALKKMVKSLTSCYKEVSDSPSTNVDDKVMKKNNVLDSCDNVLKKPINTDIDSLSSVRLPNLLSSLEGKPNVSIQKNHLLENNQHAYSFITTTENGGSGGDIQMNTAFSSTPIPNHFKSIDNGNGHDEPSPDSLLQLRKPQTKHKRRHPNEFNMVVAQCSQCNQSFSSLQQFEEHIRKSHNSRSSQTSSNVPSQSPSTVDDKIDTLNPDERNTLLQMLTNSTIKF